MLVEVLLQVLEDHVQRVVLAHHLLEAHDVRVVQLTERLWREHGIVVKHKRAVDMRISVCSGMWSVGEWTRVRNTYY